MGENNNKLSVIPLGGLGEIGKNLMVVKYREEIIIIDAGLSFPEDELLGIDIVIPDVTYLLDNKQKIKGIVLTHGHDDHIGALPYLLKDLQVPIYGTQFTIGLVKSKLAEHGDIGPVQLFCVKPRDSIRIGVFKITFFRVNHSIADAVGLAIQTPLGTIVHTGDFKIDQTPVDGQLTDFYTLTKIGENGTLLLMSDSTNAEGSGYTLSEQVVSHTYNRTFRLAKERIVIACFSSNIHRIQQIIDAAFHHQRKVAIVSKHINKMVSVALELGYLKIPADTLQETEKVLSLGRNQQVIITAGFQGEEVSNLGKVMAPENNKMGISQNDTVIISAVPVPWNEKAVARSVDYIFKQGANVVYENFQGIHVSGHGKQEELKLMINLLKPKYFLPIHGEYRMLVRHARLAEELGIPKENVFLIENGQTLEINSKSAQINGKVSAGKVLVDGLGVGDVGNIVLRDRKQLSQDGIVIVIVTLNKETGSVMVGPDVVSRGFVYVRESEELMVEVKEKVRSVLDKCLERGVTEWSVIKSNIKDLLGRFLYEKTRRRPMILPIIMEV
ncbi:MAG: ribonuclease J [Syntrophomonadaceae bacterium]|nr:ribonuclease J [Syntrophomonadaceae bacterium]